MSPNAPIVEGLFAELDAAQAGYADAADDAKQWRRRRDVAAAALADHGVSYVRIGRRLNITRSRAWQLVERARRDGAGAR